MEKITIYKKNSERFKLRLEIEDCVWDEWEKYKFNLMILKKFYACAYQLKPNISYNFSDGNTFFRGISDEKSVKLLKGYRTRTILSREEVLERGFKYTRYINLYLGFTKDRQFIKDYQELKPDLSPIVGLIKELPQVKSYTDIEYIAPHITIYAKKLEPNYCLLIGIKSKEEKPMEVVKKQSFMDRFLGFWK